MTCDDPYLLLYYVPLRLEAAEGLRKGLPCGVVLTDMLRAICGGPNYLYVTLTFGVKECTA